jgi:hypothetical protein
MTPTPADTRAAQAERVADHLETHPASTTAELATACDLGSVTKVLSAMVRELGYGLGRGRRWVACAHGTKRRSVRTYTLTHRPAPERQLPLDLA